VLEQLADRIPDRDQLPDDTNMLLRQAFACSASAHSQGSRCSIDPLHQAVSVDEEAAFANPGLSRKGTDAFAELVLQIDVNLGRFAVVAAFV
jgi:hypothetical protein